MIDLTSCYKFDKILKYSHAPLSVENRDEIGATYCRSATLWIDCSLWKVKTVMEESENGLFLERVRTGSRGPNGAHNFLTHQEQACCLIHKGLLFAHWLSVYRHLSLLQACRGCTCWTFPKLLFAPTVARPQSYLWTRPTETSWSFRIEG